jgi:hypothetical protein
VRKIREVLCLRNEARLSDRQIGAVLGSARSTVQECLKRARLAGLSWPLPAELDDEELSASVSARRDCATIPDAGFCGDPDRACAQSCDTDAPLARVQGASSDGCQYSAFCATMRPASVGKMR